MGDMVKDEMCEKVVEEQLLLLLLKRMCLA